GEASGDLHGAHLVAAIRRRGIEATCFGIGGDRMAGEGVELLRHTNEMAIMGFVEVVRHLPFIRTVLREIETALDTRRPDLVILIDYPGFNLRVAKMAKARSIPVLYYIAPQVWAWGASRMEKIVERVTRMAVILPFEEPLFQRFGMDAQFVGHPLLDRVEVRGSKTEFFRAHGLEEGRPLIGLLPGSRHQEIERLFPAMLEAVGKLRAQGMDVQAVVGAAREIPSEMLDAVMRKVGVQAKRIEGATYEVMAHSDLLWATSGTATLEAAILGTPMLILYRASFLSYLIGRMVVKIPYIGLPNIVAGRKIVPELIQREVRAERIATQAMAVLSDAGERRTMQEGLAEVRAKLGEKGASERVAGIVGEMLGA
ncbi:MAG: lipid-A-disaccharide synthase, partial [Candidatus Latescibacteria bacterium]|nr:lipid-A-disaccharide synthase [Candidatus Latescibacterota bacterium]